MFHGRQNNTIFKFKKFECLVFPSGTSGNVFQGNF